MTDLSVISAIYRRVQEAAARTRGSFAERYPELGRMHTHKHCRNRRRINTLPILPCCSEAASTSKRAWSPEKGFYQEPCEPRTAEPSVHTLLAKKRKHPHLNWFAKLVHETYLGYQRDDRLKRRDILANLGVRMTDKNGHAEVQEIRAEPEHLVNFAAMVVMRRQKARAKRIRQQQKLSRKINRRKQ